MTKWINECVYKDAGWCHENCSYSLDGIVINEEESEIPAERIIDVGSDITETVRLLLTKNTRGRYCALSHCWGPSEKRPTCVTRANEGLYFAGVNIGDLSTSFQDAILITRELGIRYLWIDSLCIVQDDEAHWRQESARMGSIYENAFLRIAANGASDSTEGLFERHSNQTPNQEPPPVIQFPLYHERSSTRALIHFRVARDSKKRQTSSPLARRGWVRMFYCKVPNA
jgi:hypothetical protein